ncbi:MAG: NAD(P)-dependent oxidoreductase [Gemmatimonadetes bacterium]|nr:NAD(P)-dependent oxidoreductase [Gemmatimonadota bacterium]
MTIADLGHPDNQVVVTGHRGFIGRHLMRRLPNARACDRDVHRLDVPESLASLLADANVIVHLAGLSAGSGFMPANEDLVRANVHTTRGLLQGIKRFARPDALVVLLSTIHVYRRVDRYDESTELAPASYYGLTKLTQELLVEEAALAGLRAVILRAGNVYGPGSQPNYNSAVATFCDRIKRDLPIELMGGGRSQANLLYVTDLVDIVMRAPELASRQATFYNVSAGASVDVRDIVGELARCSGREVDVRVAETPPVRFEIDNSRLLGALGGYEFTSLRDGLSVTYRAQAEMATT